jgi:NAD(P)-dependent dehydrogenase (short-subunit alcohol dehydrogenase family)
VRCDHHVDGEVEALFARVRSDQGRLDILVNNAIATSEPRVLWSGQRFWQLPVGLWDDLMDVGLRSHFIAARHAAPLMIEQQNGLVINVASHAAGTGKSPGSRTIAPYSVAKAALHRLSADMSAELRQYGVTVVSVWPPASRTEGMLAEPEVFGDRRGEWKDPLFTGRVVAAFASTRNHLARSGEALVIEDLAQELGVDDPPNGGDTPPNI